MVSLHSVGDASFFLVVFKRSAGPGDRASCELEPSRQADVVMNNKSITAIENTWTYRIVTYNA